MQRDCITPKNTKNTFYKKKIVRLHLRKMITIYILIKFNNETKSKRTDLYMKILCTVCGCILNLLFLFLLTVWSLNALTIESRTFPSVHSFVQFYYYYIYKLWSAQRAEENFSIWWLASWVIWLLESWKTSS